MVPTGSGCDAWHNMHKEHEQLLQSRRDLKAKLRGRKRVFGSWTSIGHPILTEIMLRAGFDFHGIDIEHSTISQEQSQRIIAASHSLSTPCLPRIASHNMEMIKRLLDSGADGIIVPMVSTQDEIANVGTWIKYPPGGQRSFGFSKAQGYGFEFFDYKATWNESSIAIVQIENIAGVRNIDRLLDNEFLDGVMIGPYDLSGSLNIPGQIDHPEVQKACETVIEACSKAGKACGTQVIEMTLPAIEKGFSSGFTFEVLSSDIFLLWKWADQVGQLISNARKA